MATASDVGVNGEKRAKISPDFLESKGVHETKALLSELCRHFYGLGWVSGTGGSITIKVHDDAIPKQNQLVVMSPSGLFSASFFAFFLQII